MSERQRISTHHGKRSTYDVELSPRSLESDSYLVINRDTGRIEWTTKDRAAAVAKAEELAAKH